MERQVIAGTGDFHILGALPYIQATINMRVFALSDMTVYLRAEDWPKDTVFFGIDDYNFGTFLVQKVTYEETEEGVFVTAFAAGAETMLDWVQFADPFDFSVNYSTAGPNFSPSAANNTWTTGIENACNMALTYYGNYHLQYLYYHGIWPQVLQITTESQISNKPASGPIEAGVGLYTGLQGALKKVGAGVRYYPAPYSGTKLPGGYGGAIVIGQGNNDKTESVIFSKANGNAASISYTYDESDAKGGATLTAQISNRNVVGQTFTDDAEHKFRWYIATDGSSQKYHLTCLAKGFYQSRMNEYVSPEQAETVTVESAETKTMAMIRSEMVAAADKVFNEHAPTDEVEVEVLQVPGCKYGTDYVLGDRVSVVIEAAGVTLPMTVTEAEVIWEDNHEEVTIKLERTNAEGGVSDGD